jgi:hypothetical protein
MMRNFEMRIKAGWYLGVGVNHSWERCMYNFGRKTEKGSGQLEDLYIHGH